MLEQGKARLAWHANIGDQHLGPLCGQRPHDIVSVSEEPTGDLSLEECLFQDPPNRCIVVYDPDWLHALLP